MSRDTVYGPGPGGGMKPMKIDTHPHHHGAGTCSAEKPCNAPIDICQGIGCVHPLHPGIETHLGGPQDSHYSVLSIQPIEVTEAWSKHWPAGVAYHLGEAIAAIARCGTKGQAVRDLKKASWLCARAAECLEKSGHEDMNIYRANGDTSLYFKQSCSCASNIGEHCETCRPGAGIKRY